MTTKSKNNLENLPFGRERILIVDDNVLLGETLEKLLNKKGFEPEYLENPLDVITLLKRKQFDIALIDLHMPDISGIDLAKEIMGRHPSIITIIMTGAGGIEDYMKSKYAGVSGFINKPFETATLIRMIEEINKESDD